MNPIIKPTSISIKPTFNQSVVRQLLEARPVTWKLSEGGSPRGPGTLWMTR